MKEWVGLLAVLAFACGEERGEVHPQAVQGPSPRAGVDVGAQRARVDDSIPGRGSVIPSEDRSARPSWVGGGGGGTGGRFPDRNGRPMMSEEEAKAAAGALASETPDGDSPCEQAFGVLSRFATEFQEKTPWVPRRGPDRRRFLQGCLALPRPLQECLVPSYHRANAAECEEVRQRWPAMTGEDATRPPEGEDR